MSAITHPDYKQENERLQYTIKYVVKTLNAMLSKQGVVSEQLDASKKGLASGDSSQEYIDLMINSILEISIKDKITNLEKARTKPYFARIDFKENGRSEAEKLYIGKMALIRDEDQKLLIVDWRAPVANLYYESRIGNTNYKCHDGTIEGELLIKRQFSIEDGILKDVFDIDITTNDEFLQSYLGANAENRLKDIVSTIQYEQNKIIRADMWTPLIVQGAAGSGKTTIALHRIAYLIYQYEQHFVPENFMIIAPNTLFLNYISDVLPELGVERVKQTTFEELAFELIGKRFKLTDKDENLVSFVDYNNTSHQRDINELIKKSAMFKSSIVFKEILDEYMKKVEQNFIPKENFMISKFLIYKYEDLNQFFTEEYSYLPMNKRINELKKRLKNRLKSKHDELINEVQTACDKRVYKYKRDISNEDERRRLIIETIDKKDGIVKNLNNLAQKLVNNYIKKISKLNPFEYYREFIENTEYINELLEKYNKRIFEELGFHIDKELSSFILNRSIEIFNKGFIEFEDLAPIIYIKYKIYGIDEKIPVKHVVIDEAQDFSVFQFYVMRKIIDESSFTILGDLSQGIHSYRGITDWTRVKKYAFEEAKCQLLTLEQSYRTTVEIMNAANIVISKLKNRGTVLAKPVIRHGYKVNFIKNDTSEDVAASIKLDVDDFIKKGFKSIAIICKTMHKCKEVYKSLKDMNNKPYIITGKEKQYKSGFVIVPSYLSKGLEFDCVIIADGDKESYSEDELDIKLLYVAMTRALHVLKIHYIGKISSLLL